MLVCPLCRIALGPNDAVCPRDGRSGNDVSLHRPPEQLLKRFHLLEPFAHGDGGTLYLADEPETGRRGLLKVLGPAPKSQAAERQRLRRELVKQATLETPYVGTPLATGETSGVTWVFREWLGGVSLRVRLSRGGALPQGEALAIAAQLASALDDLHRAGLLHRDVKPGHVFLVPAAGGLTRALLIDAGLCTIYESSERGPVAGTPGYVAPEQLQGKLVSFRSDLYALGCVMYEMLAGRPAFQGDTPPAIFAAQLASELPPLPSDLPSTVFGLLKSLLAKNPQERPFSAQKLRRTLDPFLPDGAPATRQATGAFAGLSGQRKSIAPNPSGTLRPPPPPASPVAAHIVPSARASTPPGARSLANPPAPARKERPDSTQQLDFGQIVELAPNVAGTASTPSPKRAPAAHEATQALDIDQLLEIAPQRAPEHRASAPPPRPMAEHTLPIRLEQILGVVHAKKERMVPPPSEPSSRESAPLDDPAPPEAEAFDFPEPAEDPELPQPAQASLPEPASLNAFPQGEREAEKPTDASLGGREHTDQDPASSDAGPDSAAAIAAPPGQLHAHESSVNLPQRTPLDSPQAAGAAQLEGESATATPTPASVELADAPDSQPLSALSETSDPLAEAQHVADENGDTLAAGAPRKKLAYVAAAVVLLGLVGVGAGAMFGADDGAPVAQTDTARAADMTREPTPDTRATARPVAPSPPVPPVETPKGEAAAPALAPLPTEPAPSAVPPAAPASTEAPPATDEQTAEQDRPAVDARGRRSSRAERRREQRNKQSASEASPSSDTNMQRWSEARDQARAHYAAQRYKLAAQTYEQATRYNPSHAGTFAGLGAARAQLGDARGAIKAYQKAIQLSPDTSGFHAALGRAYVISGDKSRARSAYKKALALDPQNQAAKQALADL